MSGRFVNGLYDVDSAAAACAPCLDSHGRSNPMDKTFDYLGRRWRVLMWQPGLADAGTMVPLPTPTGTSKDWQMYGWPTKTAYRQAGQPQVQYSDWLTSHPETRGRITIGAPDTGNGDIGPPTTPGQTDSTGGAGILSSIEHAFSNIPTTYLLIGGAIVAVMVLKKRR